MSRKHTFIGTIQPGRGGGAFVEVPFDVEEVFKEPRPQVRASVNGESYLTRLVRMGRPTHIVAVPKAVRDHAGKSVGDQIEITVEADATPREVLVPADLAQALRLRPAAAAFFDKLSYTHRKEYVRWIEEAKKPETRTSRVAKTVERLTAGLRGI